MMRRSAKALIVIAICSTLLCSCGLFFQGFRAHMGSIKVEIGSAKSKTVHPFETESGMEIASYQVDFIDPSGGSQTETAGITGLVEKNDAIEGLWTVNVAALNASGNVLGRGSGTVEVQPGRIQTLRIEITPSGIGSISVKVDWSANSLVEADYTAKLYLLKEGADPEELPLVVDAQAKKAAWSSSAVQSGSHELLARMIDATGKVLWGQRESFFVYEGLVSAKTFTVDQAQMNRKPEVAPEIGAMERAPDKIAINWMCASARVDTFKIEKKAEPDGAWTSVAEIQYGTYRYVDAGVTQGSTYSYRLKGVNTFGESDWSAIRQVSVPTIVEVADADNRISTDTTWTSDKTYVVKNIKIDAGATLTIQPGVRVIFKVNDLPGGEPFYMVVDGTLKALGTASEPVVFTTIAANPAVGSWGNIRFNDSSSDANFDAEGNYQNGSVLQNCVLEYSKGINVTDSAPYLDGVTLRNASNVAISGQPGTGKSMRIRKLVASGPGDGWFSSNIDQKLFINGMQIKGWGSFAINGTAEVAGLDLETGYGNNRDAIFFGSVSMSNSSLKNAYIVRFNSGTHSISETTFSNLQYGVQVSSASKITFDKCIFKNNSERHLAIDSSSFSITGSSFDQASDGIAINSNSSGEFAYNTVKNSSRYAMSLGSPGAMEVHHNTFNANSRGGYVIYASQASRVCFSGNNLVNPDALRELQVAGTDDFWAGANWWGTTLTSAVDQRINDGNDTFYDGIAHYEPIMKKTVADTDVIVLPEGKSSREVYGNSTTLAWKVVGGTADSYKLQVSEDKTFAAPLFDGSVDTTSQKVTGLEFGKTFYWRVAAVAGGVQSDYGPSNVVDVQRLSFSADGSRGLAMTAKKTYIWGYWSVFGFGEMRFPKIVEWTGFNKISNSSNHKTFMLKSDGTLYSWGAGDQGQLGFGDMIYYYSPKKLDLGEKIVDVDGGEYSGYAVTASGKVYGWGYNDRHQIIGTTTDNQPTPVQITGLPVIKSLAALYNHVLAIDAEGKVWAWGANWSGQCGTIPADKQSMPVNVILPVKVVKAEVGYGFSVALGEDKNLYVWGSSSYWDSDHQPRKVDNISSVIDIIAGGSFILAIDDAGRLYSMGENGSGTLGLGDQISRRTLTQVPITSPVYSIAASNNTGYAVDIDGRIWAWGSNGNYKIGDGTDRTRYSPVEIFMP